jgi:hypothetical protein
MIIYEHALPTLIILLALIAALAIGAFSFWRYMPKKLITVAIPALYALFLLGLVWCILLPGRREVETHTLKPRFIVALDNSQSMLLTPDVAISSRWDIARQALKLPWASIVDADCDIETYTFANAVGEKITLDAVDAVEANGTSTLLRDGVKSIASRYAGLNVAGMLLLTDGSDTREAYSDWASDSAPFPIFTLQLEPEGMWQDEPDIRVDSVNTPRRVTKDWNSELKTVISGQGTQGNAVGVQLYKNGRLVDEKPVQIPADGGTREVAFELEHPEVGAYDYRVFVPPMEGESNTNDNEYVVSVRVGDSKNRLLYVEGTPRWEYKYLRRTLIANSEITPMIFFTGVDGKPRGGVPVGTMTANMDESELTFVKIVVLGNLSGEELTTARARNLVKYVEDGGSLVILGGPKVWSADGISATPLKDILPVKTHATEAVESQEPMPVRLTDVARSHPAFAGDIELWDSIPPILSVFPDAGLSAGATALVTVDSAQGPQSVVVTHRYGQGKVAVILTDTLWKWQLAPGAFKGKFYQRFWAQLISWLMPTEEDVDKDTIEAFASADRLHLGEELDIQARIGETLAGIETMQCLITLPDKREIPYTMESQYVTTSSGKSHPGFTVRFKAETAGLHSAIVVAEQDGKRTTSDPISFFVKPFTPESVPRPIDADVLRALASASGGQFFPTLETLDSRLSELNPNMIEDETETYKTLWRHWLMISLLMTLMTTTWVVRKLQNMP